MTTPCAAATAFAATAVIAAALGFALPTSAALAAENPIPDPVAVLAPPTAPITNLFTSGEETPTDSNLDHNLPPQLAEATGNALQALDLVENLTGHDGDNAEGSETQNSSSTGSVPGAAGEHTHAHVPNPAGPSLP